MKRLAFVLTAAVAAFASSPGLEEAFREASSTVQFESAAVSPDGRSVAWAERQEDGRSTVWVRLAGQPARQVERGSTVAWAPDSKRLAYLAAGTVHVVTVGEWRVQAAKLPDGLVDAPAWSPDGRQIAVLYTESLARAAGPRDPVGRRTGVIEAVVPVQRILVMDDDGSGARVVSPAGRNVHEFAWAPDSRRFAAVVSTPPGNANWWFSTLDRIDIASGAGTTLLMPKMQIALPRWSPDGKSVAFVGGLMSDEGVVGGDVYEVPAAGGVPVNRTPGLKASATRLWWTGSGIVFAAHEDGGTALYRMGHGLPRLLWRGAESAALWPDAEGRVFSAVRGTGMTPPELWLGTPGQWSAVTRVNAARKAVYGEVRSLHWKSDRFTVQGWLFAPKTVVKGRRYPMIVMVHGGPGSQRTSSWPRSMDFALLASEGYFILCPNPRGSFGAGEEFTRANVKDFGGGDLRDILRGVDEAVRVAPVDPRRVGITGWSYGGYMTMWAVTQSTRFAAAAAGAGIVDWRSYYGQNEISTWLLPFFGASVYADPAVYARSAPIEFIQRVKTPSLVLVGEYDAECPSPQSYEFWRALKTLGVSTKLVVYEGEGHDIRDPGHRRDILDRMAEWFAMYLK